MAPLRILHLGEPAKYDPAFYATTLAPYEIIRPSTEERARDAFMQALRSRRWGDFDAVMRPFWLSGGEMGRWDAELVGLLPATVRVFASAGAGFDWVDTEALGKRGVVYCNSSPACAESVADFATALVVSTFRQLQWCAVAGASGDAAQWRASHANSIEACRTLGGKVLGIVGFGNIGTRLARRLGAGFGMEVHYHDVERKPEAAERGAVFHDSLESLVRAADCVVMCAPPPAAPGAAPMMGAAQFAWFRPGARFVNVARGSMVDGDALADALAGGRIFAAALDVHADEPHVNARLQRMARLTPLDDVEEGDKRDASARGRVMLTCHNGGGTLETYIGFERLAVENVAAVLGGGQPKTPVNLQFLEK
jgi:lactate dehydrogenase-like 2-hydroxyacid dehydrogenase